MNDAEDESDISGLESDTSDDDDDVQVVPQIVIIDSEDDVYGLESDESEDNEYEPRMIPQRMSEAAKKKLEYKNTIEYKERLATREKHELKRLLANQDKFYDASQQRVIYLLRRHYVQRNDDILKLLTSLSTTNQGPLRNNGQPTHFLTIRFEDANLFCKFVPIYLAQEQTNSHLDAETLAAQPKFNFFCAFLKNDWRALNTSMHEFLAQSFLFLNARPRVWKIIEKIILETVTQRDLVEGVVPNMFNAHGVPLTHSFWFSKAIQYTPTSKILSTESFQSRGCLSVSLGEFVDYFADDNVVMHIKTSDFNRAIFIGFYPMGLFHSANVLLPPNLNFVWEPGYVNEIPYYNVATHPNALRSGEILGDENGHDLQARHRVFTIHTELAPKPPPVTRTRLFV